MDVAISIRGVTKTYAHGEAAVRALDDVDLDAWRGELMLIMGPSGSGKTTLLSVMGCILRPSSGTIGLLGRDVTGLSERELPRLRREHIGQRAERTAQPLAPHQLFLGLGREIGQDHNPLADEDIDQILINPDHFPVGLQHVRALAARTFRIGEVRDLGAVGGEKLLRFVTALAEQSDNAPGRVALYEWHRPPSPLKLGPICDWG